jgi:hypothetical protein
MKSSLVTLLLILVSMSACTWDQGQLDATVSHFEDHRAEYESLLKEARAGNASAEDAKYKALFPEGLVIRLNPLSIEAKPVDYYYVVVFAESGAALQRSNAMRDEGHVIKKLQDGWVVVQRGFN